MILVIGGTGRLGRQVVELLVQRGRPVRVLTRDPRRAALPRTGGVQLVGGDLRQRDSLGPALDGVDTVVCTAHGGEGAGSNGPRGIEGRGIPELIGLATGRLAQFVYISTASARLDSPSEFFRLKAQAERRLRASGIPYSLLRPPHLLDTWVPMLAKPLAKKDRAMVIGAGQNPVSWVGAHDVAAVAATLAGEPGTGFTADLGGPEPLTLRELNQQLERALGVTAKRSTVMSPAMLRFG